MHQTVNILLSKPKNLIICFSGTACVTFNPLLQKFYCILSICIKRSMYTSSVVSLFWLLDAVILYVLVGWLISDVSNGCCTH